MANELKFTDVETKAINLMIKQGCEVLLDQELLENLAKDIKAHGDPVDAMVDVILPVIKDVHAAAESAGKKFRLEVTVYAGRELVKILVAVLGAAGLVKPEQANEVASNVFAAGIFAHNKSLGQGGEQPMSPEAAPQGGLIQQGAM